MWRFYCGTLFYCLNRSATIGKGAAIGKYVAVVENNFCYFFYCGVFYCDVAIDDRCGNRTLPHLAAISALLYDPLVYLRWGKTSKTTVFSPFSTFFLNPSCILFQCNSHDSAITVHSGGIPLPGRDMVGKNLSTRGKTTVRSKLEAPSEDI